MRRSLSIGFALAFVSLAGRSHADKVPQPEADALCKAYGWTGNPPLPTLVMARAISDVTGVDCRGKEVYAVHQIKIGSEGAFGDNTYALDGLLRTSELLRTTVVGDCVPVYSNGTLLTDIDDKRVIERAAICGPDFRRMDRKAYDAELDQLKLGPTAKKQAGDYFDKAKAAFAAIYTPLVEKAKTDAALKELIVDAPERLWKDWEEQSAPFADALKSVDAVEEKFLADYPKTNKLPTPGATPKGCDTIRDAIGKIVTTQKITSREAFAQAIRSPIGSVLATGQILCDIYAGRYTSAAMYKELVYTETPVGKLIFRGPRYAIRHGLAVSIEELRKKNVWSPLKRDDLHGGYRSDTMTNIDSGLEQVIYLSPDRVNAKLIGDQKWDIPGGLVMAAKKHPLGLELTFKKATWEIPEYDCKDTGRTRGYQSDGTRIAERDCKFTGKTIKKSAEQTPVVVPATFEGLIKPGMTVTIRSGVFRDGNGREAGDGRVHAAYPFEIMKGKKLIALYDFAMP